MYKNNNCHTKYVIIEMSYGIIIDAINQLIKYVDFYWKIMYPQGTSCPKYIDTSIQ